MICLAMRVTVVLAIGGVVLLLAGWTADAAVPTPPPKCSPADTQQQAILRRGSSLLDPTKPEISGGGGIGIAQWTYPSRKQGLFDFARARNSRPLTLKTQIRYVWYELTHDFKDVRVDLARARNITNATRLVMNRYEKPSVKRFSERLRWGRVPGQELRVSVDRA